MVTWAPGEQARWHAVGMSVFAQEQSIVELTRMDTVLDPIVAGHQAVFQGVANRAYGPFGHWAMPGERVFVDNPGASMAQRVRDLGIELGLGLEAFLRGAPVAVAGGFTDRVVRRLPGTGDFTYGERTATDVDMFPVFTPVLVPGGEYRALMITRFYDMITGAGGQVYHAGCKLRGVVVSDGEEVVLQLMLWVQRSMSDVLRTLDGECCKVAAIFDGSPGREPLVVGTAGYVECCRRRMVPITSHMLVGRGAAPERVVRFAEKGFLPVAGAPSSIPGTSSSDSARRPQRSAATVATGGRVRRRGWETYHLPRGAGARGPRRTQGWSGGARERPTRRGRRARRR